MKCLRRVRVSAKVHLRIARGQSRAGLEGGWLGEG